MSISNVIIFILFLLLVLLMKNKGLLGGSEIISFNPIVPRFYLFNSSDDLEHSDVKQHITEVEPYFKDYDLKGFYTYKSFERLFDSEPMDKKLEQWFKLKAGLGVLIEKDISLLISYEVEHTKQKFYIDFIQSTLCARGSCYLIFSIFIERLKLINKNYYTYLIDGSYSNPDDFYTARILGDIHLKQMRIRNERMFIPKDNNVILNKLLRTNDLIFENSSDIKKSIIESRGLPCYLSLLKKNENSVVYMNAYRAEDICYFILDKGIELDLPINKRLFIYRSCYIIKWDASDKRFITKKECIKKYGDTLLTEARWMFFPKLFSDSYKGIIDGFEYSDIISENKPETEDEAEDLFKFFRIEYTGNPSKDEFTKLKTSIILFYRTYLKVLSNELKYMGFGPEMQKVDPNKPYLTLYDT